MLFYNMFDIYYLVLVLPTIIFALLCQWKVSSAFKKYSSIRTRNGMTGADAAREICKMGGASHVGIETTAGNLTDHFDPRSQVIRLSQQVYGVPSIAAVGVAAHEAGHASQYAHGYGPVRLRSAIIPVTQVASNLAVPLVLAGFIFNLGLLIHIGILFFAVAFFFQLVTLPVEFNASKRAIAMLETGGFLDEQELKDAKKVLSAAAMTYVAAMAVSLAQLLRLLLLARRRNSR